MAFTSLSSPSAASLVSNFDDTNSATSARTVSAVSPPLGQDPSASFVSESQILLPSFRVAIPTVMDQQALMSSIAAIYDRLDVKNDVMDNYRSL